MKTLFRTCVLLIIGLVAIYTAGCGENIEQELDTEMVPADSSTEVNEPIATDGKPITVTDATFEAVVLNAETPVMLELGAEW